jgi:hypothetical protein
MSNSQKASEREESIQGSSQQYSVFRSLTDGFESERMCFPTGSEMNVMVEPSAFGCGVTLTLLSRQKAFEVRYSRNDRGDSGWLDLRPK